MSSLQPPDLKTALILLFRSAPPFVLYPDNPDQVYAELKSIIQAANSGQPKLIEKSASGPIKKVSFLDTELIGVSQQVGVLPAAPGT
jgi:hypothetical protein